MTPGTLVAGALVAAAGLFAKWSSAPTPFSPHACANVETYLPAHVVGQQLALRQLADAVCTHVARHQRGGGGGIITAGQEDDDDQSLSTSRNVLSRFAADGRRAAGWAGSVVASGRRHDDEQQKRRRRRRRQQQQQAAPPDASRQHNSKPLVISVHGPPGVGKTLTHTLLARAIYGRGDPAVAEGGGVAPAGAPLTGSSSSNNPNDLCPGRACRGYRVFYGMDYLSSERAQRIEALRADLLTHLRQNPDALVVVEEYDKLDCTARSMWRQLLQRPEDANVTTLHRAVVLLESNLGMSELEGMLTGEEVNGGGGAGAEGATAAKTASEVAAARERASPEEAERRLRDAVFARWRRDGCEAYEDTLKLVSLVDFFLPYFPLERRHVDELIRRALRERAARFSAAVGQALAAADEEGEEDGEEEAEELVGAECQGDGGPEAEEEESALAFWPPPQQHCRGGRRAARLKPAIIRVAWSPAVVDFLSSRVEFSGPFPLEGAKGVESAVTRHVARLLRRAAEALAQQRQWRRAATPTELLLPDTVLLFVGGGGSSAGPSHQQQLQAELMTADEARARGGGGGGAVVVAAAVGPDPACSAGAGGGGGGTGACAAQR